MKKLILGLMAILVFTVTGNAHKNHQTEIVSKCSENSTGASSTFLIVKGKKGNLIAFPSSISKNEKYIYIFLTDEKNDSFKNQTLENCTIEYLKNEVRFVSKNSDVITFKIDSKQTANCYTGYGLVKIEDPQYLASLHSLTSSNINVDIPEVYRADCRANGTSDADCNCSGGHGATECSCSGGIATASWSSGVSCGVGTYACCPAKATPKTVIRTE